MQAEQPVNEMVEEVLWRQAEAHAQRTGQPLVQAPRPSSRPQPVASFRSWQALCTNMRRRATGRLIS